MFAKPVSLYWLIVLRIIAGVYWLYFGVGKWSGYEWIHDLIEEAGRNHPISVYGQFLSNVVAPNWQLVGLIQTIAETLVGIGLLFGLLTRLSAAVGVILALNLAFALGFSFPDFALVFWYYALSVLLNITILTTNTGRIFGLDRLIIAKVRTRRILRLLL